MIQRVRWIPVDWRGIPGWSTSRTLSNRDRRCQGHSRRTRAERACARSGFGGRERRLGKHLSIHEGDHLSLVPVEPALELLVAIHEGSHFLRVATLGRERLLELMLGAETIIGSIDPGLELLSFPLF